MRTRGVLRLVVAAALTFNVARSEFSSQRADASLCSVEGCFDFKLVLANFGVFPYGQYLEFADFRIWQPEEDPEYPPACGTGPTSFCQFSCVPEAFETDNGMLALAPRSAIGVLRSLGGQANEAECSFFTKVQVAQTTKAEAVIVLNERDNDAITMDTTKANGELTLDVQTKPSFILERRYVAGVKEFLNTTAGDRMRMTIDLRNLFPQHTKVDVTMWGSRLWRCAYHSATEQDCRRRVELMEASLFSDQMESFLRQDEARIFVRQPNVDVCRKQDNSPVDPQFQDFCNNTQLVQAHCIHAGRYCQPQDPDGSARGNSGGREALIETLRCKCVQEVTQNFGEGQFYFAYMKAWANVCLPQGDFSNECSLESFNEAAISQWSQEALAMANTTREEIQQTLASCVETNTANLDEDVPNELFEEDARLDSSVFIDPTISVNGEQIRGAYIAENMLPAICSAFRDGFEPESCLKYSTSLCDVGGEAYNECRSGYFAGAGRTRCRNEFGSFACECESNQRSMEYEPTPEEKALFPDLSSTEFYRCVDENQCIDVGTCPAGRICLNKGNAHECVLKEEACTEENNWGGCYQSDLRTAGTENGPPLTACVSRISELRALAASGDVSVQTEAPYNCSCAALPCHRGNGLQCEQLCPLEECLNRENPAISTCVLAADSRGVGIGPISSGGVLGIVSAAFMLLTIAGLLFAMRYQKQNRDRLIDLSALVRGFTIGSDGTPRNQHGPYTPGGRMMATATPSSLYHNAAFQHRSRDTDTAAFLPGPDSRGPSSTGTAGPIGPTSGPSGPGHSGGTGGLSGERFRPIGSILAQGRRESPPARRTIRPPPPGHIPQQMLPDEDRTLPQSAHTRGPQREIVIGPRPLAEDRSTSVPSREGSLRALDAFGSISEYMITWSSRRFRRSHSHSTSHTNSNSRSGSVAASVTPSCASVRSGRVSATLQEHNNSAERVGTHSSGIVHEQELQEFGERTDSESFRVVDEVLRRGAEVVDAGEGPAGAALNLDTSRFADVTLHSTTDIDRAMHTMDKGMITDEGMSSFAAVTASSGGLTQSPQASGNPAGNTSPNTNGVGGTHGVGTGHPSRHSDTRTHNNIHSHPEKPLKRHSGLEASADGDVVDISTPDISEGNEGERGGTVGWVEHDARETSRARSRVGSEDHERRTEEPTRQDKETESAMTRALKEVPSENSAVIYNTVNGGGDSIQNHMWGTLGSSAFGTALGVSQSTSVGSACLLQEHASRSRYARHDRVPDIPIHADCLVEESSRLSGAISGATSGSGGSKEGVDDGSGRGGGTSSTLLVDTPSPVAPEDRRVGPFMDAEDLLTTSELFGSKRNMTTHELLGPQYTERSGRTVQPSSLRHSQGSYSAAHSRPAAAGTVSSACGAQATIASRVDPAPLTDSAALGSSSILGSIQSSSFDVIKRIQMMLPGWRSSVRSSSEDQRAAVGAAVHVDDDSRRSGMSDAHEHASVSLGRCPSLQLSQLQECPDSQFDGMNTCDQFL